MTEPRFLHHSPYIINGIEDKRKDYEKNITIKPNGFWLSVGTDFFQWEENHGFYVNSAQHYYEFFLKNTCVFQTDITKPCDTHLFVCTPDNVVNMHDRYYKCYGRHGLAQMKDMHEWGGIAYLKYSMWDLTQTLKQEGQTLADSFMLSAHYTWYYMVDASSVVIFNPDIIESFEEIPAPPLPSIQDEDDDEDEDEESENIHE